ncbi:hypothetical protein SAMN04489761_0583 [Tenacibaculum sp. MAR_2009_124]|uniref:hypothetical protein n=1 Tax=Tenacibaculum sp. MAR_2009_124 TaxID=1250059 RepID=UPI00089AA799|nr:hypothetical protein [Tenacibaculum sp. MAR_2009_124]SEB41699.1 hypothetical protein SAMN04489761_0583 [Tenacibaculum sp. MAR_2009_124]
MKTLINIMITIGITILTMVSAAANTNPTSPKNKKNIRTQIITLLGKEIPSDKLEASEAHVNFIINANDEIVVIEVTSKSNKLSEMIKNKLNYKKINVSKSQRGSFYEVPVKLDIIG